MKEKKLRSKIHTYTRIAFCRKCARENRPKTGNLFLAYGSTSKQFLEMEAQHNGIEGFTPHTYEVFTREGKIYARRACAMNECGTGYRKNEAGGKVWTLYGSAWSLWEEITLSNFKALVGFTDTGLKV